MHFAPSIPCPYLAKVITKVMRIFRKNSTKRSQTPRNIVLISVDLLSVSFVVVLFQPFVVLSRLLTPFAGQIAAQSELDEVPTVRQQEVGVHVTAVDHSSHLFKR